MLKEFAWKAFENTGDLKTYIFYKEIEEKDRIIDETEIVKQEVAISTF